MKKRILLISLGLFTAMAPVRTASAWGQDWQQSGNNTGNNSPSPTPAPSATPAPMSTGKAADSQSPDTRYITVDLEVATPQYTARGFKSSGCALNGMIHFNARRSTFRGYYEGSQRNATTDPSPSPGLPTSQGVTDPNRLTQQPTPVPSASPTAVSAPPPSIANNNQNYNWWQSWDWAPTARQYAGKGNKRRHHVWHD